VRESIGSGSIMNSWGLSRHRRRCFFGREVGAVTAISRGESGRAVVGDAMFSATRAELDENGNRMFAALHTVNALVDSPWRWSEEADGCAVTALSVGTRVDVLAPVPIVDLLPNQPTKQIFLHISCKK